MHPRVVNLKQKQKSLAGPRSVNHGYLPSKALKAIHTSKSSSYYNTSFRCGNLRDVQKAYP